MGTVDIDDDDELLLMVIKLQVQVVMEFQWLKSKAATTMDHS